MKKIWLATLLSVILPSLGQFYTRQFLLGFSIIAMLLFFELLSNTINKYFILINLLIWLFSIINANKAAKRFNISDDQKS